MECIIIIQNIACTLHIYPNSRMHEYSLKRYGIVRRGVTIFVCVDGRVIPMPLPFCMDVMCACRGIDFFHYQINNCAFESKRGKFSFILCPPNRHSSSFSPRMRHIIAPTCLLYSVRHSPFLLCGLLAYIYASIVYLIYHRVYHSIRFIRIQQ